MSPTFEPETYNELINEVSKIAREDDAKSIDVYYDILVGCTPERAAMLHAKGMERAAKRVRKKRCSDK